MDAAVRKYVFIGLSILAGILLITRLVQLQVVQEKEFGKESQKNSIKKITETPARGLMYDRNNKVLVDNKPSYTMTITPFQFDKNLINEISSLINEDPEYIKELLVKAKGTNRFNPIKIKRDIDFKLISYLEENKERLKGVSYQVESLRYYPIKFKGSHIFGYNSEITEKQLDEQEGTYYKQGDLVGSTGLERFYETYLRGEKGSKLLSVDVNGKEVGPYNEGKNDIKALNGSDLFLALDADLQEYAEKLMSNKRGAIIAVDPRTGEILCMVSKPDFDLSIFSGTPDAKSIAKLFNDENKPVFNRVTQTRYPPGSTWKMMMCFAGLGSEKITTTSTIACGGSFTFGNRTFEDHGAYGAINLTRALEVSANVFFYKLSLMIGLDNYNKYGKMFGFGSKTGIDLPHETSGLLPSTAYFDKVYGQNKWGQGLLVSLGIGQGELGVSPVQMVSYVSAICMDGIYNQPHFVRKVVNQTTNEEKMIQYTQRKIELLQKYFDAVKKGMYLVVNGTGTAKNIRNSEYVIAGKTGTAQNPNGNNHSWFVGYAPYGDPKIAVCVLGENAGWGNQFAAPIAAALMVRYLSGNNADIYNENNVVKVND